MDKYIESLIALLDQYSLSHSLSVHLLQYCKSIDVLNKAGKKSVYIICMDHIMDCGKSHTNELELYYLHTVKQ